MRVRVIVWYCNIYSGIDTTLTEIVNSLQLYVTVALETG